MEAVDRGNRAEEMSFVSVSVVAWEQTRVNLEPAGGGTEFDALLARSVTSSRERLSQPRQ